MPRSKPPPVGGNGAGEPQAGGAGEPQAGTGAGGQEPPEGNGQAPASGNQQQAGGASETPEQKAARLERELVETRREAAEHRTKRRELEQAQEQQRQAGLTEAERAAERTRQLEEQNRSLQARIRESALESAAIAAATKLNFRNPEVAVRLLDRSSIEWNEDTDHPKGVEAQLRKLAEQEPYLVKGAAGDYGGGNRGDTPGGKPPGMNELLHAALRRD